MIRSDKFQEIAEIASGQNPIRHSGARVLGSGEVDWTTGEFRARVVTLDGELVADVALTNVSVDEYRVLRADDISLSVEKTPIWGCIDAAQVYWKPFGEGEELPIATWGMRPGTPVTPVKYGCTELRWDQGFVIRLPRGEV